MNLLLALVGSVVIGLGAGMLTQDRPRWVGLGLSLVLGLAWMFICLAVPT